jgi:hypothetical protein
MSALGHSLPTLSAPVPINVRFTPDNGHQPHGLRVCFAHCVCFSRMSRKKRLRPELSWKIDVIEQRRDGNVDFVSERWQKSAF